MTERDGTVYVGELQATPAPPPPVLTNINNGDLEELYLDHPFNWAVNYALFRLGDAGVLADIHRFRQSYSKLKALKRENERLTRIIGAIQKEQEGHNKEIRTFTGEVKGLKSRLTTARVRNRIAPLLACLAIEGMAPDPIYPYGRQHKPPTLLEPPSLPMQVEEPLKKRPATPQPPLNEPIEEEQGYVPSTPSDYEPGPPATGGIPASSSDNNQEPALHYSDALAPRVADYSAGNVRGPHHQPTPFDTEQARSWLPLPGPSTATHSTGHHTYPPPAQTPKCFHCKNRGHASANCPSPHERCRRSQRCTVPRRHANFNCLCQYGRTRARWQDDRGHMRNPRSLFTFDPLLRDVLAEDAFDAESDEEREGKGKTVAWTPPPPAPFSIPPPHWQQHLVNTGTASSFRSSASPRWPSPPPQPPHPGPPLHSGFEPIGPPLATQLSLPNGEGEEDESWLEAWEPLSTEGVMLRTLGPGPQDSEEVDRLAVRADTGC
jgi:hypothetical protein